MINVRTLFILQFIILFVMVTIAATVIITAYSTLSAYTNVTMSILLPSIFGLVLALGTLIMSLFRVRFAFLLGFFIVIISCIEMINALLKLPNWTLWNLSYWTYLLTNGIVYVPAVLGVLAFTVSIMFLIVNLTGLIKLKKQVRTISK